MLTHPLSTSGREAGCRITAQRRPLVLIVDDERLIRETSARVLQEAGFDTVEAADGFTALSSFISRQPDIVLLDLVMPGKDGIQTCRDIRSLPGGKYTPVLIVTSLDGAEAVHQAFDAGTTDFINKPVGDALLVYRVRYLLESAKSMKKLAYSERRLAYAQQAARLGNWECDPETGCFSGSRETYRILGLDPSQGEYPLDRFVTALHQEDRAAFIAFIGKVTSAGAAESLECRVRNASGVHTMRIHGDARTQSGGRRLVRGTIQDVTEMRRVEDSLRILKQAVDCLPVGITITGVDGRIIYSNPADAEMHGYAAEELVGMEVGVFAPQRLKSPTADNRKRSVGLWRRESVNIRRDGEEFPVQLSSISVTDVDGRCLGMVTACEDITGRKEAEKRIYQLAYHDTLTGLPNRQMFLERLHQALSAARRDGHTVSLLFLDLDNFKDINDTLGHDFGDHFLKEVALRLQSAMRTSDTLARPGGDEFMIILSSLHQEEGSAAAAQRILSLLAAPFTVQGRGLYASASIGIAVYPDDATDADQLYKSADTAMYHAKCEGKSRYRFFSAEMNKKIMRRVAIENSMRHSLEKGEVFLEYQPQWDLKQGKISGVEALVRWKNEELGAIEPSEFIPIAESTGLIVDLGEYVLRNACLQGRKWELDGRRGLKIAVNISAKQLRHRDFLQSVVDVIQDTGINPASLEFEFTESVMMENTEETVAIFRPLKELGVRLAIDDFGTGYSSLSYLKHLPIDRIKIDRAFVGDLSPDGGDTSIVDAIISMARSLRLQIVAEGVETTEQLRFLTQRGCIVAQGFLLGEPMPPQLLEQFIDRVDGAPSEVSARYPAQQASP